MLPNALRLTVKLLSSTKILTTATSSTFRYWKSSTSQNCPTSFQWPGENPLDNIRTSELEQKVQSLKAIQAEQAVVDKAQNSLSNYRRSLREKALRVYQEEWVRT